MKMSGLSRLILSPVWVPAIVAALTIALPGTLRSQGTNLNAEDRRGIAMSIYALIQEHFAHWDGAPRSEVEQGYREYSEEVVRAATRKEFDLATLRFIAKLRNGHTQFNDSQADSRPIKFRLLEVENRWVVLDTQDSRLPRGSIVRTINARPVEEFVRESAKYVHASNDRLARTHVFSYPILFSKQVSVGLGNGAVVVVNRAVPGDALTTAPTIDGRWLIDGKLAYVRIPSFGDPANENTALGLVRRFASAPNLIVDVRGNGGGTTPRQLIGALMNRPWRTWKQINPAVESSTQRPDAAAYSGHLFLIVDRFCGSACEDFVMPFKDTGRAIVIGETTQGSSGNPYRMDLGHGMSIAIGAIRYRFPDGKAFEGVGIEPDVAVERRIIDIAAGRDVFLKKAQELASRTN